MSNRQPHIKNHFVYRVPITVINQEFSQVLSSSSTYITISADDLTSQFLLSFKSGGSATGKTVPAGAEWASPGFIMGAKTIYIQSPTTMVAVIEEWDGA